MPVFQPNCINVKRAFIKSEGMWASPGNIKEKDTGVENIDSLKTGKRSYLGYLVRRENL
jgi:hypothetical protein